MNKQKVQPRPEVLSRYLSLAQQLARKTGKLPNPSWLKRNGYVNLYQYMLAHPRAFKGIKQEQGGPRTHDEAARKRWVAVARRLARENKGRLPTVTWLTNNGYSSLLSYMWKHPQFFASIRREKDQKNASQHLQTAALLARRHGGRLPASSVILKEGGWALYQFMRRKPRLFKNLGGRRSLAVK